MGFPQTTLSPFSFFNRMLKLAKFSGEKYSAYSSGVCWEKIKHSVSMCIRTKYFCNQLSNFLGSKNTGSATAIKKQTVKLVLVLGDFPLLHAFISFLSFLSSIFFIEKKNKRNHNLGNMVSGIDVLHPIQVFSCSECGQWST